MDKEWDKPLVSVLWCDYSLQILKITLGYKQEVDFGNFIIVHKKCHQKENIIVSRYTFS
jgi:hypothetical protein